MSTEDQSKVYVLRNLAFWYDDEYYSTLYDGSDHIGRMCAIFDDKDAAIKEWTRLEYEFTHRVGFDNFMTNEWLHQLEDRGYKDCYDPRFRSLCPTELFEIINEVDCHAYALCEYPKELKQHVFWNKADNNYDTCDANTDYDFRENLFVDASFIKDDPLLQHISPPLDERANQTIPLKGTLSELSDTPLLLSTLIQHDSNLEYDESCQVLRIQPDSNTLNSVNALLRNPLSPNSLTIEEIYHIEQNLKQSDATKEV